MLKIMVLLAFSFSGLSSFAATLAEQSMPELKKTICDTQAIPPKSKFTAPSLVTALGAVDRTYIHNCGLADSFAKIEYHISQRESGCRYTCANKYHKLSGADVKVCQEECRVHAESLATRVGYFEKGLKAAEALECGVQKKTGNSTAKPKKKSGSDVGIQ